MADGSEKDEPEDGLVRRQVILTVRCVLDVPAYMTEDGVQFYVEEHLCKSDLIMSLAEQIASDDEKGECNVCVMAEARVVPVKDELPSAWLANLPPPAPASFMSGGDKEEELEDEDADEAEDEEDDEKDIEDEDTEPGEKKD